MGIRHENGKTSIVRRQLLIGLALTVAVLAVFWQVHDHDFVNFDDQEYITDNPLVRAGLTFKGIARASTTFHAGNWHPLTWLSHMNPSSGLALAPRCFAGNTSV